MQGWGESIKKEHLYYQLIHMTSRLPGNQSAPSLAFLGRGYTLCHSVRSRESSSDQNRAPVHILAAFSLGLHRRELPGGKSPKQRKRRPLPLSLREGHGSAEKALGQERSTSLPPTKCFQLELFSGFILY